MAWVLPKTKHLPFCREQSRRHIYLQASHTCTFSYLSSSSFGDNSHTNSQLSAETGLQICCFMSQTLINGRKGPNNLVSRVACWWAVPAGSGTQQGPSQKPSIGTDRLPPPKTSHCSEVMILLRAFHGLNWEWLQEKLRLTQSSWNLATVLLKSCGWPPNQMDNQAFVSEASQTWPGKNTNDKETDRWRQLPQLPSVANKCEKETKTLAKSFMPPLLINNSMVSGLLK